MEARRKDVGLTQAALAQKAGVARSTVIAIELGHHSTPETRERIADALTASGARGVNGDSLILVEVYQDPELGPKAHRLGNLLCWLPFEDPNDQIWDALKPAGMRSGDYLLDNLGRIAAELTTDDDRRYHVDIGYEMRYILLFLRRTPNTLAALSQAFATTEAPEVAARWYDDVQASAWSLWSATQPGPPN